jgi:hypothetical protein
VRQFGLAHWRKKHRTGADRAIRQRLIRLAGPDARDQARAAIGVAPRGTLVWLLPRSVLASLAVALALVLLVVLLEIGG